MSHYVHILRVKYGLAQQNFGYISDICVTLDGAYLINKLNAFGAFQTMSEINCPIDRIDFCCTFSTTTRQQRCRIILNAGEQSLDVGTITRKIIITYP